MGFADWHTVHGIEKLVGRSGWTVEADGEMYTDHFKQYDSMSPDDFLVHILDVAAEQGEPVVWTNAKGIRKA